MSTLSERMVMRLSPELSEWIGEQAELEGLDSATWVRSHLTRFKNGLIGRAAVPQIAPGRVAQLTEDVAQANEILDDIPLIEEATAPVDADAMVAEALGQAEAQGLTAPREDAQQPLDVGGVRALIRRPPPFSNTPVL